MRGYRLLQSATTTGPRVLAVIDGRSVDDLTIRATVTAAAADLRRIRQVQAVYDAYSTPLPMLRARDGRASLVAIDFRRNVPDGVLNRAVDAATYRLRAIPGVTVRVGGDLLLSRQVNDTVNADLARGERVSLPLALVAMVVIFGGLVAAGVPLVAAAVSIAGTLLLLLGYSHLTDVSPNVISVVTVLGLGLAIDYSLLIVNRFREERSQGLDLPTAIERTAATAGRTIAFSALTVAVALAGLFAFDDPTYRSFGAAGVGVVLVALAAALTLVPALLGLWGRRISVPSAPPGDDGFFARVTRRVQRRPLPVVVLVGLGLGLTVVPFLGAQFRNGGAHLLPRSFETRQVADMLASRFPGQRAEPVSVVGRVASSDPRVQAYAAGLRSRPGVADVSIRTSLSGSVSAIDVVPFGESEGPVAQRLVRELRAHRPDYPTLVTGDAAYLVDFKAAILHGLPWAVGSIALASLVLLFLMTGSVLVPIKALVMNVLSLGASFGALVLIFQDGHGAGLLGFDPTGAIETWVPVIVFVFAFGLSMDYEVFLLARIKELYDEGHDTREAVALGLQRSGRIITSAALLIVIVFAGFAAGQMLGIKEMGLALGLAVLLDATLIRCLLVPATMTLLGDWNWWAPGPLRRWHRRFGLHERASLPPAPVPAQRSPDLDTSASVR